MNSKKNNKPNIFEYATKELSQDAMICWLLKWSEAGQSDDRELHDCGVRFVCALLRKHDPKIQLNEIDEVEIHQQDQKIDVLARVKDKSDRQYVLLIEDKTGTKNHGEQLKEYYTKVADGKTKLGPVNKDENLYPIYLKTGNQSLRDDRCIEENKRIEGKYNYKVFNRQDFLEVFELYAGDNAILLDFRQHLEQLEYRTNSYKEWTKEEREQNDKGEYWYWNAWEGFYRCLEEKLSRNKWGYGWGYVPNPAGGFLGWWWWPVDSKLYLQIECNKKKRGGWRDARLCFKVSSEDKDDKRELKWCWHNRVIKAGGQQVTKPKIMRIGNAMTVALWKEDWMAFGEDGKLDITQTVENLRQVSDVVKKAAESESPENKEISA